MKNNPTNITYLGPAGATFSAIAYDKLAAMYGAPLSTDAGVTFSLATENKEVLPLMLEHGGFGTIAMETRADGRVDPPVNSFIEFVRTYNNDCPIQVIGALCMKIHFVLMAKKGVSIGDIQTVIAHPRAFGACWENVKKLGVAVQTIEVPSNGKAAEDAAHADLSAKVAALGPIEAAQKYGLEVLSEAFEDKEAVTTFYFLGPQSYAAVPILALSQSSSITRALLVFRVKHNPGALVKALKPFADKKINLRLIHSLHLENGVYDFAIETESKSSRLEWHQKAMHAAQKHMDRWIQFGPFPVNVE